MKNRIIAAVAAIVLLAAPANSCEPKAKCKEGTIKELEPGRYLLCKNGKWQQENHQKGKPWPREA